MITLKHKNKSKTSKNTVTLIALLINILHNIVEKLDTFNLAFQYNTLIEALLQKISHLTINVLQEYRPNSIVANEVIGLFEQAVKRFNGMLINMDITKLIEKTQSVIADTKKLSEHQQDKEGKSNDVDLQQQIYLSYIKLLPKTISICKDEHDEYILKKCISTFGKFKENIEQDIRYYLQKILMLGENAYSTFIQIKNGFISETDIYENKFIADVPRRFIEAYPNKSELVLLINLARLLDDYNEENTYTKKSNPTLRGLDVDEMVDTIVEEDVTLQANLETMHKIISLYGNVFKDRFYPELKAGHFFAKKFSMTDLLPISISNDSKPPINPTINPFFTH